VRLDAFAKGIHMQAKYTRLFVDEHGGSRFEDLATELQPGFCPPGMVTPGFSVPFLITDVGSFWIGAPSVWKDDSPAGNSRETPFAKSGTDGSNPVPSSGESTNFRFLSRRRL
jgi:hypothetical protein